MKILFADKNKKLRQRERQKIIAKGKVKRILKLGKTITGKIILATAIICGLGSPYLLMPWKWPRRRYYTLNSLQKDFLPEEDPEKVRKSLYYLKRKKLIIWEMKESKIFLKLTKEGKKYFDRYSFEKISLSKDKQWDGFWRFLLFDIPEKYRDLRDIFRDKLQSLGFFQIQKSVWIFPYECEKELNFIIDYLQIAQYVLMFTVKIKNDRLLRKFFIKKGFKL